VTLRAAVEIRRASNVTLRDLVALLAVEVLPQRPQILGQASAEVWINILVCRRKFALSPCRHLRTLMRASGAYGTSRKKSANWTRHIGDKAFSKALTSSANLDLVRPVHHRRNRYLSRYRFAGSTVDSSLPADTAASDSGPRLPRFYLIRGQSSRSRARTSRTPRFMRDGFRTGGCRGIS
jgi:hypothetical protein